MKKQKIVTLILLLLLLTSTIQFQQKISKYMGNIAFFTEHPAAAIVCFANTIVTKDHWKSTVGILGL